MSDPLTAQQILDAGTAPTLFKAPRKPASSQHDDAVVLASERLGESNVSDETKAAFARLVVSARAGGGMSSVVRYREARRTMLWDNLPDDGVDGSRPNPVQEHRQHLQADMVRRVRAGHGL